MRKLKLFSMLLLLLIGVGQVWATDPVTIVADFQCNCSEAGTSPDLFTASSGTAGSSYYSLAPGASIVSKKSYDVDPSQTVSITMKLGTYGGYESGKNDVKFYLVDGNGKQVSSDFTSNFTAKYTTAGGKAFSGTVSLNDGEDGKGVYFKFVPVATSGSKYARFHTLSVTYTPASGGGSQQPAVSFAPEAGTYCSTQNVTLSSDVDGATIYYTTNGSNPTTSSSVYSSAISVSSTTTIKAFAKKDSNTGDVAEATYTITSKEDPTITPTDGNVEVGSNLDVSTLFTSNSEGAITYSITAGSSYASLSGSTLTGSATGSVTVQASQAANGCYNAKTATATITVNEHVITPGTYDSPALGYAFWGLNAEKTSATANEVDYTGSFHDVTVNIKNNTKTNAWFKEGFTRAYADYTMVISVPSGFNITQIVFSAESGKWAGDPTASPASTGSTAKTWTGKSNSVTFTFSGTDGMTGISVTYAAEVKSAVSLAAPTGGTLVIKDGEDAISNGDQFSEEKELTVIATPDSENHYIGGVVKVVKTENSEDVTSDVLSGTTLTVPAYDITVSATFTPTYAITKVADGGSIALSYTQGDAEEGYATAGTSVTATATADGSHVFTSILLTNNVENPSISGNVATFTMPASAVTVTAEFAVKQDPSIVVTDGTNPITELDFGSVAKGSTPVAQTFKLSGLNLAQGTLMIASSDDTKFTVSPTNINVDGTLEETTVTVTPVTSVAGPFNDEFIMISGGGLAQADEVMIGLSLTVQETYTAKWYVNGAEQTASTVTVVEGMELTFPDAPTPAGDCAGTEFMGWLTAPLAEASADEPEGLIKTYTGHTMPAADVNYYAVFAEETPGEEVEDTYSHTIEAKTWEDNNVTEHTLSDVNWTLSKTGGDYWGYDGTKGQQVGSGGAPASAMSLTTSGISGKITSVKIYTSGAKDVVATVAASVNGVAYKNDNSTSPVAISSTNTGYEFTGSETGEIVISWAQTSSKALYFKQIEVRYAAPGASTYSNYVTTCVACSNVSLVEAGETNGTITLKEGIKEVSSVKTCNGAVTLTTNAVAETGYELTNIALSGVANATVNQEMTEITIPANATGELTVTATFTQKNYEVALAQSPAAGATLNGATTTAHYNATINISTTVPDGYMFAGWTPANLFANTEAANAISTSFTMPNDDVTVTANFTQIYTVADALALVPEAGDNSDYVYVGGLISYVDETSWDENYKNINYYISANGTRENELLVYHGYKGSDKETFDAITDIKAGDKVIVYGKLTNYQGTKEFAQNNKSGVYSYIYQFTEAILSSVEVGGTLAKTDYFINDDFTREGLTATAVYSNTGYSKDITDEATWTNNLAGGKVTEDGTVRVTATYNLVSGYKDVEVTVTTKVLESIELSETALTGYLGQAVQKPATVTAHFDDNGVKTTENVTAFASFDDSDYDASSTAEQTITVSYQFGNAPAQTADYTITLSSIRNTIETAYTVEKGRSIIDLDNLAENNLELDDEGNKVFVQGYITDITSNKYTIKDNIEDTEFIEIYEGTLGDGISSVKVGDLIKVEGNLYFYENNSHTVQKHQILNGEIVAVVRTPNLTVADVEMEVNITADLAEDDLTINKDGSNGDITFACTDPAVTIVNNKLHAAAAGDATVTATIVADGIYTAATTTFNVHVIAERTRYSVTFDANGADGGSAPEAIAKQLEDATVDLPACSYSWAGHKFTGWTVTAAGEPVEVENNQFTMPAADVTVTAQWAEVATAKISFMVGGKEKASIDKEQDVAFTIAQDGSAWAPTGFTFVGWATEEQAEETEVAPATITEYTPQAGIAEVSLYGIYSRLDISGANYGKYEKATAVAEGDYLIVCEDENVVFDGSLATLDATSNTQAATISDGVLTLANADNYVFTIAAMTGGYSIKSASNKYIGNTGTKNGLSATADEILNQVSISNGNAVITSGSTNYLKYNKTSGQERFRYFTSNSQESIQLYKKNLGTTYYTSSPVEKVTITFDANGGEGGCQNAIINKGSQLTICAEAPAKSHNEFAGWKNGDDVYEAGQAYTFDADITLTAQWNAAATYTVTFDKNGGTGTAETLEDQYAGDAITLPAVLTKDDYNFQGWKYDDKLYEAGASFTMPAADVAFVAQWRKASIPVDMMSKVTDASALADGMQVALGYGSGENFAMAGDISSKFMSSITEGVTMSNGVATYTNDVIVMTLEQAESGWKITKDGTNYLTLNGADVKWDTQANATVWTITFENGNAKIATSTYWIQYNSSSPRFKTYGTSSNMKDIQLYGKAVVVTDDAYISDLGYVEGDVIVVNSGVELAMNAPSAPTSITVKDGATVTVSAQTTANNITVEEGGTVEISAATTAATVTVKKGAKMEIEEGGSVTTDEPLILYTTLGKGTGTSTSGNAPGSSSEIINAERLNANSDVFIEIELTQEDKASTGWYAFSVPFPVDAMNGVYYGNTKLTNEVGYAIMSYHGDIRATGKYGWKKFREIMQPGVLYVITVGNTDYKTLRFKKVAGANLAVTNSDVAVNDYPSTNPANAAWNGIGNPNLAISNLSTSVPVMQFYDHKTNTFVGRNHSVNLVVGSAFFIQYNGGETVSIPVGTTSNNGYLAPQRERQMAEEMVYEVQLTNAATGELEDNVFLTAREDAMNSYEIGRDVAKMSMGAAKCAQMYVPAYGTTLCAADFQLVNDKAEYPLTITAPADGTYRIEAAEAYEDATLYLTKDGRAIWNLSMSACEVELTKGTTENYGLLLVRKTPGVATGMENVESQESRAESAEKVIIDNQVFILRGGQMYDLTGKKIEK